MDSRANLDFASITSILIRRDDFGSIGRRARTFLHFHRELASHVRGISLTRSVAVTYTQCRYGAKEGAEREESLNPGQGAEEGPRSVSRDGGVRAQGPQRHHSGFSLQSAGNQETRSLGLVWPPAIMPFSASSHRVGEYILCTMYYEPFGLREAWIRYPRIFSSLTNSHGGGDGGGPLSYSGNISKEAHGLRFAE